MTTTRIRFTEYLDLDLDREAWRCNRCDTELVSARRPYKEGCLVYERDPRKDLTALLDPTRIVLRGRVVPARTAGSARAAG